MSAEFFPLIQRATQLHHDLMAAGLVQTGQAMHKVVQKIGWEVASRIEAADPQKVDSAR